MDKQNESKEILISALERALSLIEKGKVKEAGPILDAAFSIAKEFPDMLWMDKNIWKLGKSFLILYHIDHFDNEEDNLFLAHYSFCYFYRGIELLKQSNESDDELFLAYNNLIALMKTCSDCFYVTIANFYIPESEKNNEEVAKAARKLAMSISPLMLYCFLLEVEDAFGSFREDEFLESACTDIEIEYPEMNDDLLTEARKIIRLLYGFLKQKIAKRELKLF